MKPLIYIVLIYLFLSSRIFSQSLDKAYAINQKMELSSNINGFDGYIQILQDASIKSEDEMEYWYQPDLNYLKAVIQIVDKSNNILLIEKTDYHLVYLDKVYLYGNEKPTFLITVNNYCGAGRETGHLTFFIEIENKEIKYVVDKEGLQSALGCGWKIDNYKKEKNKQIFLVDSSNFEELILKRYFFDGKDWNCKEKKIKGEWWEEGEKEFPSLNLFK